MTLKLSFDLSYMYIINVRVSPSYPVNFNKWIGALAYTNDVIDFTGSCVNYNYIRNYLIHIALSYIFLLFLKNLT